VAWAHRNSRMPSMSRCVNGPPVQTRFKVCSYSSVRDTERFMRQRRSPTSRRRRWEAPRCDRIAATITLVSMTIWYMGPFRIARCEGGHRGLAYHAVLALRLGYNFPDRHSVGVWGDPLPERVLRPGSRCTAAMRGVD
jgi:hypothetical protein